MTILLNHSYNFFLPDAHIEKRTKKKVTGSLPAVSAPAQQAAKPKAKPKTAPTPAAKPKAKPKTAPTPAAKPKAKPKPAPTPAAKPKAKPKMAPTPSAKLKTAIAGNGYDTDATQSSVSSKETASQISNLLRAMPESPSKIDEALKMLGEDDIPVAQPVTPPQAQAEPPRKTLAEERQILKIVGHDYQQGEAQF